MLSSFYLQLAKEMHQRQKKLSEQQQGLSSEAMLLNWQRDTENKLGEFYDDWASSEGISHEAFFKELLAEFPIQRELPRDIPVKTLISLALGHLSLQIFEKAKALQEKNHNLAS